MRVSLNQLHTTAQRALESIGFPYGADDEGAALVVGLECIGLEGARRLLARLPLLARTGYPDCLHPQGAPPGCFDGGLAAGGLALAPPVVDWCRCQGEQHGGVARARINGAGNGEGPWYMAAALAAPPGWSLDVRWNEDGRGFCGHRDANGNASLFHNINNGLEDNIQVISSYDSRSSPPPLPPAYEPWRSAAECRERRRRCLREGVVVDGETWQALRRHAANVLVAATPGSTERGAGGGDAND